MFSKKAQDYESPIVRFGAWFVGVMSRVIRPITSRTGWVSRNGAGVVSRPHPEAKAQPCFARSGSGPSLPNEAFFEVRKWA